MTLGSIARQFSLAPLVVSRAHAIGAAFLLSVIAAGCEQSVGSETPDISRIEVDPAQVTVSAGRTTTLSSRVFGGDGVDLGAIPVFWSTQNAQVATVNQAGVVTGVGVGSTQIAASLNGRSGVAIVTVTALPVAVVRVTPGEGDVTIGKTIQLHAEALDGDGGPLISKTPTWSSTNPTVATVDAAGVVSGLSAGSTTIRATIDGVHGSALVRVVPIAVARLTVTPDRATLPQGEATQLDALAFDGQGNPLSNRVVIWSSNNPSVAVVDISGRVQTVTPGSATITATCEGISASAVITVTLVPVASITISPSNPSVVVGGNAALTATVIDGKGNVLNGRTVSWSSSAPAVATINGSGVVSGVALGTTTISATSGGVTGTTTVTVAAVPVANVTVSPPSGSVVVGGTLPLTATARDAQGNTLAGRPAQWSTNQPGIATVSPAGVVTGVSPGAATITATIDGTIGVATITVNQVAVASVSVTPNPASVVEGGTLQLSALARDASGTVLSNRTIFWTSSNTTVATVASSGVVTGVAPGTATITATSPDGGGGSNPSGSTTLTVTYAPVASVVVSPATASVTVGSTTTFAATLRDASGQTLSANGRSVVWASSNTSRATINATTGVATGVSAGTATITATATSPGQNTPGTGTAALTVTSASGGTVTSVSVSPTPATVHVGSIYARQFTAQALDGSGNALTGKTATWSSSNPSVATVSSSGVVSGVAAGSATITATIDGVAGTSAVAVDLVSVSSVNVTPPSATITHPGTQQLSATPRDSAGNAISGSALGGRTTTWSSSNSGVATVSTSGLVTTVAAGTATISGTIGGTAGTSTITVPGYTVTVAISPDSLILPGTLSGMVTVTDASGPVAGAAVSLSSSNTSVATVAPASGSTDATGQVSFTVTGVAGGTANITATSAAGSGSKTVRMLRPIATVSVYQALPSSPVAVGAKATFIVVARDASGGAVGGRLCSFVSSNPAVASVSTASDITTGNGRASTQVTAVSTGSATITATCESKSAQSTMTVF